MYALASGHKKNSERVETIRTNAENYKFKSYLEFFGEGMQGNSTLTFLLSASQAHLVSP